jgi:hypothetical protein
MLKKLTIAIIAISTTTLSAQTTISQNRELPHFKAVVVNSGIDLYLSQGNTEQLTVSAADNKIDHIITEVKNETLHIYFEKSNWSLNWNNQSAPKVQLTFKDLETIRANGGSDVYSKERLIFENIDIHANGGSDVKIELNAVAVNVAAAGGSDALLSGTTKYLHATASGGSDVKAKNLTSKYCKVEASGGSDAYVFTDFELQAVASGGSDVHYYGNPQHIKKNSSGGSDVTRR